MKINLVGQVVGALFAGTRATQQWKMRRLTIFFAIGLSLQFTGGHSDASPLIEAFKEKDIRAFDKLLRAGADANQMIDGTPLLHQAVANKDFEFAKFLLWHNTDVLATDSTGERAFDKIKEIRADDESLELNYLLRAHTLIRQHGRPSQPISRPNLVLVFEPTVDYLHPEIAPYYYINQVEQNGQEGVDDDGNGFIDDLYGWTVRHERPHQLTPIQQVIMQGRADQISRLLTVYSKITLGKLQGSSPEVEALTNSYTNPVTSMFGRSMGFSDLEYMEQLAALSHGSHVAGIVIKASKQEALVHNLSWDAYGDHGDWYLESFPIPKSGSLDDYIEQLRTELLPEMLHLGRRGSDYLRATGAGVVNGSVERPFAPFIRTAQGLAAVMQQHDPSIQPQLSELVVRLAIELYAYMAIPMITVVGENPNVLFVAAAGNSAANNDLNLQIPGYLSRFFPNFITVAAEGAEPGSGPSHFTNFGSKSVNIAAPGTHIESCGIAGTRVVMNGTSQAAPMLAGLAAAVRHRRPDISASELRRAFEVSAKRDEKWEGKVSSGGVVDVEGFMTRTLGNQILKFND